MAHFDEGCVDGNSLLAVGENRSSFGFRGGRHDGADGLKLCEYWFIRSSIWTDVGWWCVFTYVVVTCGATARFSLDEIRGIDVYVEAHVARMEPDDDVWLFGCIVHEHLCLLDGVCGRISLLGANFIECDEHCGVDGTRDVEESAGNALYARDAAFVKFWCGRGVGGVLHLGPIRGHEPFLGRVLGARGHGVLELLYGFADRVGIGDVDVIAKVVPFYDKPALRAVRWVDNDGVIILERVEDVGGFVGGKEIDTKVIYNEGESGRQGCVGPKTGCVRQKSVAMELEVAEKACRQLFCLPLVRTSPF